MSPKSGGAESPKVEKPEPVVAVTTTPAKRRAAAASVASVVEKEKEIVKETPPSASKKVSFCTFFKKPTCILDIIPVFVR